MNSSIARTVYEPLDKLRLQFRLLEIAEPDDNNKAGPVAVKTHTVSLQDSPSFAALSYVWGDPTETADIIVNGVPRKVTKSLSEALRHVAKHAVPHMNQRGDDKCKRQAFRLWADAICINQDNFEERSHQVGLMGRIYSSASLVVAWLSNEDKGLPLVFFALESLCQEVEVVNSGHVDALHAVTWMEDHENDLFRLIPISERPEGQGKGPLATAVCGLCRLPYWQRVWIIQEVALSRDLIYTTPSASIHRPTFERGLRYLLHLSTKSWGKGATTKKPNEDAKKSELLETLFYMGLYKHLPRQAKWDRILDKQFESLSSPKAESSGNSTNYSASLSLKGFQHDASDARDHVYGLLGLTGLNIIPDYTKTIRHVLLDYVRAIISSNRGTDSELCFLDSAPKALHSDADNLDLPSWTPSRSSYDHCRADRPCHATRGVFHQYDFPEPKAQERSLFAGGSRIQRIKRFIEIPDNNMLWRAEGKSLCDLLEEFAGDAHVAYHTGCSMPRALWSTVLCKTDGDADMSPFLVYFRKGVFTGEQNVGQTSNVQRFPGLWECLREDRQRLEGGVENETRLPSSMKDPTTTVLFNWGLMLKRIKGAVELFETEGGYLGVGPKGCIVQDEVCLLKGCASPLLLRPEARECHSVVGPCFVLGLMDGEAKTLLQDGRCKRQTFELV